MKNMVFSTIEVGDITAAIRKAISDEFEKRQMHQPTADKIVSRIEAAKILGVSLPVLDRKTSQGEIIGYRIGKRKKYKANELIDALKKIKPVTHE